jgi:hypothetical protein
VSSIWPEQLKTDGVKNEGPKLLRQYLEYARDVSQGKFLPQLDHQNEQNASWYLNSRLKEWGENKFDSIIFEPNTLPFSDLNFKTTSQYLGIILTDDTRYYTSFSAKEIYAYTPALLSHKNWSYRMIFSRNFWQDRQKIEDELSIFIGQKM